MWSVYQKAMIMQQSTTKPVLVPPMLGPYLVGSSSLTCCQSFLDVRWLNNSERIFHPIFMGFHVVAGPSKALF